MEKYKNIYHQVSLTSLKNMFFQRYPWSTLPPNSLFTTASITKIRVHIPLPKKKKESSLQNYLPVHVSRQKTCIRAKCTCGEGASRARFMACLSRSREMSLEIEPMPIPSTLAAANPSEGRSPAELWLKSRTGTGFFGFTTGCGGGFASCVR